MRKSLILLIFAVSLALWGLFIIPKISVVHAKPNFDITIVRGTITGPDNQAFKKANVVVACEGETKTDKTDNKGGYKVIFFGRNTCEAGDIATVTATKDGVSGSGSGTVLLKRDGRFVDINFAVINFSVPEFGLLTGAVALMGSAGTFYALRLKKRV